MRKSIQTPCPTRHEIRVIEDRPIPFQLTDRALAALETGDLRGSRHRGWWTVRLRDFQVWQRAEAAVAAVAARSAEVTR
jgi:hypothetical protein